MVTCDGDAPYRLFNCMGWAARRTRSQIPMPRDTIMEDE